jgi:hypothetical protein
MKSFAKVILGFSVVLFLFSSCKKEDVREPYIASYNATDIYTSDGQTFTDNYSFVITKSNVSSDRILLNGFSNTPGVAVEATVSGNNFTIPQQTLVVDGTNIGISGSGSLSGNRLTYSYSLTLLTVTLNISGTANKL